MNAVISEVSPFTSALWNSLLGMSASWSIGPSSSVWITRNIRRSWLATAVPTLKDTHTRETKEKENNLGEFVFNPLPQHLAPFLRGFLHLLSLETNSFSAFEFHTTAWNTESYGIIHLSHHATYQDDKSQQHVELHLPSTDSGGGVLQWGCVLRFVCYILSAVGISLLETCCCPFTGARLAELGDYTVYC